MDEKDYRTTKPRRSIGAMYSSPGPIYMLPTLIGERSHDTRSTHAKGPAYSMAKPLNDLYDDKSPGPAAYAPNTKYTNTGESASPKYTITGIKKELKFGEGPGPADYNVEPGKKIVYHTTPSYPIAGKPATLRTDTTPEIDYFYGYITTIPSKSPIGPNAYRLPQPAIRSEIKSSPAFTIAGRHDPLTSAKLPGPSDYSVGSPDIYLTAGPHYSMAGAKVPDWKADFPGPPTYEHEKVHAHLPGIPKFTMGIRHSPYKGEFAVKYNDD